MNSRRHLSLVLQGVGAWALFFVLGLPDYYQQYSAPVIGSASVLLQALIGVSAFAVLLPISPENRMAVACWAAFYFSVPFAALDIAYCVLFKGLGVAYLRDYWYLSVFYVSMWVAFPPAAWVLNRANGRQSPG
jgi:hypothetical protein